jgi:ssDNA-binding Zn-finger/Zn-ribbon topoisomerase 1
MAFTKYKSSYKRSNKVDCVYCPECGVGMVLRNGKAGDIARNQFYGCQRFPLCCGTRPLASTSGTVVGGKPFDSFTKLLLDAHKAAIEHLAKPSLLDRAGAVAWWVNRKVVLSDLVQLEATIEEASAKAAALGYPKDFLQEAHDTRMEHIRTKYRTVDEKSKFINDLTRIRSMPRPKFLRRWDTSNLDQLEALFDTSDQLVIGASNQ